jgi:hypothetical protein
MNKPSINDYSYFDIEPITGVVVEVQQKSQLNLGMIRGNLEFVFYLKIFIIILV